MATKTRFKRITDNMLLAALEYVGMGLPILPIHTPISDSRCSCGDTDCKYVGKHPRTRNGYKDVTTYESQIRKWWGKNPVANIGIATGEQSGLIVMDVDGRRGELSLRYKQLPGTV